MDAMTQQNTALVEQASAAAQEMHEQSAALAQVVSVFKLEAAGSLSGGREPATTDKLRLQHWPTHAAGAAARS